MPAEDKLLAMKCRRVLARKECDISLMEIGCLNGIVHLTGEIRKPRGYKGQMDLRDELASIVTMILRIPEVKDVSEDVLIRET